MARQAAHMDPEIHCISLNSRELDNDLPRPRRNCYLVELFSTQNSDIARRKLRSKMNTELTKHDPYREFSIRLGAGNVGKHKTLVMKHLGTKVTEDDLQYYASVVTKGKTQWVWANKDNLDYWKYMARRGYDVIGVLKDIDKKNREEWRLGRGRRGL